MSEEFSSLLLGLGIFMLIIIPFVIYGVNRKMKKNKVHNQLFQLAKDNNMVIHMHEISDDFCVGIDNQIKKLLFIKKNEKEEKVILVDLHLIKHCEARNVSKNDKGSSGFSSVIDSLEMVLKYKDSTHPDLRLTFFNTESSLQISNELMVLENWVKIINTAVK